MHEDYERARNLDGGAAGGTTENCGRQGKAEKEAEWTTGGGGGVQAGQNPRYTNATS